MFRATLLPFLLTAVCSTPTLASIYNNIKDIPSPNYDFIIVGAGTAGSVMASRLSEDPSAKVLVIEAGISDSRPDTEPLKIPFLALSIGTGVSYDWNYTTTPQAGLKGRSLPYPRGFVMGGSSSNNGLVYLRGPMEDWDRLASVSGDPGWSWNNMQPFFLKSERHVPSWSHRDDVGEYNPAVHGFGPLQTSLPGNVSDLETRVMETSKELGGEFAYNLDLNSGNGLGVGWFQDTVGNGARISSSVAYLRPALASRPNLDLLIETRVTRLHLSSNMSGPEFRTVEFSKNVSGPYNRLTASKEVIMCAGTIGTPQILMLSGIGPKTHISSLGIKPLVDLPDVGQNLQDQPVLGFQWSVPFSRLSDFVNNQTAFSTALAQYQADQTGVLASSCALNTVAFLRVPNSSSLLKAHRDPSAGPHSPHFQIVFYNGFLPNAGQAPPLNGSWISSGLVLQAPTSRGSVTLASNSAFDQPLIDVAFLNTSWDIGVILESFKAMKRFLSAHPWKGYFGQPYAAAQNLTSDEATIDYARTLSFPIKHPVSTARISRFTDKTGVVGPDLAVKGIQGLRVVDASILPYAVGGYPQAQVYAVAERAASLVKEKPSANPGVAGQCCVALRQCCAVL
ncbi:aryl-alcohol oxidase-like protein [Mycena vulgaris]|nr:aryl-alcohol oxidase-like protein [Mycena vulgaris]